MADFKPLHPLGNLDELVEKHSFFGPGSAAITIGVRKSVECAQLFAGNGNQAKIAKKLNFDSSTGKATETKGFTALPIAPGQWILISKNSAPGFADGVAKSINGLGYLSQQSDSRICLRVSGPKARELMSRGCRLDLHESHSGAGFCAQTVMAQIGVILHQLDDNPTYELYLYAGFARSFFHWLSHSAAQFGCDIEIISNQIKR